LTKRDEIEKAIRMGEYIKKGMCPHLSLGPYALQSSVKLSSKKPWRYTLSGNTDTSRGCIPTPCQIPDKSI
jgi:hypothetical protein